MKFGPVTHRKNVDAVEQLRTKEKLSGPQIAKRLSLPLTWVSYQLQKLGLNERISIVGSADNLTRAQALRAQGWCWKRIAKELGVERWQSLARAHYVSKR